LTGWPLGRHSRPAMGSRPSCSRLLVSTLMTGSPSAWWSLTCWLRERNWASRSGCWAPSSVLTLACRLQPFPLQQSAHRRGRDRVPLPGQRLGQVPQRLGRPPQRRFRIAALVGLHQRQQGWEEIGVAAGGRLASPTWPADAAGRQRRLAGLRLNDALADGRLADAGDLRDRAHATVAQQPRLDRQRQALLALVEVGQQDRQPGGELTTDLHRYAHAPHTTPASPKTENNTLFRSSSHRCWNLLAKVPTHAQAEVKAAFWQIFDDIDAEPGEAAVAQARQRAHAFADRYDRCYPAAVACVLDTLPELTTFLRFRASTGPGSAAPT
jgi:hypothetical protein